MFHRHSAQSAQSAPSVPAHFAVALRISGIFRLVACEDYECEGCMKAIGKGCEWV